MSHQQSATADAWTEHLLQAAERLRSEPGWRKFEDPRPGQGDGWDHPGDDDDDALRRGVEIPAGTEIAAAEGTEILAEPTRLINKTAVAIVFVDGIETEDKVSDAEKWDVLAEWLEATDWIRSNRPSANISWVVNAYQATVDMKPWQGAPFSGLNGDYYDRFPLPSITLSTERSTSSALMSEPTVRRPFRTTFDFRALLPAKTQGSPKRSATTGTTWGPLRRESTRCSGARRTRRSICSEAPSTFASIPTPSRLTRATRS